MNKKEYAELIRDFARKNLEISKKNKEIQDLKIELEEKIVIMIDWGKVWRTHDKTTKNMVSAIEQCEIEELVEKALKGEL